METVYAIDAHIAEFIHTQETGTITSAEYEAAEGIEAASIITSARESRDKNVLSAYLKELRTTKLLTPVEELDLSRENLSQEELRIKLTGQLMLLVSRHVSKRRLLAAPHDAHPVVRQCVTALSLQRTIKNLERAIKQSTYGSYERRKLNTSRAKAINELSELIASVDFRSLKSRSILRELYSVKGMEQRQRAKVEKEFMRIVDEIDAALVRSLSARERLVKSNLRLVVGLARRYLNWGMPLADIIQEGNLGLMRAAEKFDYRLGARFSTYASWWIRQAIVRCIDGQRSSIRLPVYMNERFKKMRKITRQIVQDTGAEPMPSSIAEAIGLSSRHVDEMQQILQDTVSLETQTGKDDGPLKYFIVDPAATSPLDDIVKDQRLKTADHALNILAPREQEIIRLRFGIGSETEHTLEEIGQIFGLSRERIRQLEDKALAKLKRSPTMKNCYDQYF